MKTHSIAVIGASNVDICATAIFPLIQGDSNPGKVTLGFGGVGRNIAENLCRLGQSLSFLTAYGDDSFGEMLRRQALELGLDVSHSLRAQNTPSSVYTCINQPDGEMSIAVNDMEVCNNISPEVLRDRLPHLHSQEAILLDANLSTEALAFIADKCEIPLFADTVSNKKAVKLMPILSRFTGIKTNRSEAEVLTGLSIRSERDALLAAEFLHKAGIMYVFLTMGSDGALVSDGRHAFCMPSMIQGMVNTTGCGDAFFAGAVLAWLEQEDAESMLRYGLGMAALCAADRRSVSPAINRSALLEILKQHHKEVRKYEIS